MITGVQVSSLKPLLQTPAQVRQAFARLREMGSDTLQLQWIDPSVRIETIAQALDENGLQSVSVQDFYEVIRQNKAYYIDLNRRTGGTWMCVSRIPERLKSLPGLEQYAQELRDFASELGCVGQKLCFHPVSADYQPIEGVDPVARLMELMPELQLCLDLYHLGRCGYDMPAWIRRHAQRICMVHFKDARKLPDGTEQLVPAGQGEIDWHGVVQACMEAQVPYGFVEQERWDRDPFDCLKEALDWVQSQISSVR